ncbi:MAG: STAS domain-containing protein [Phycisphaerales bacterium]|nr:STAS domain-containing protein [Phycisphaerales bacterium]
MTPEGALPIDVEPAAEAVIVRPHGNVDLSTSPDLRAALQEAVARKQPHTIVDLSQVGYMDSSGVATLVEALQLARRSNGDLILCGLTDRVQSIFQIARLDAIFQIAQTLEDAMGGDT